MTTPMRVLVVDDHPLFLAGVTGLLASVPDTEVVATAGDGEAAVRHLLEAHRSESAAHLADRVLAHLLAPRPAPRHLEPLHDDASFLLLKIA